MHDSHSTGEPSFLRGSRREKNLMAITEERPTAGGDLAPVFYSTYTKTTSLSNRARTALCMQTALLHYTEHGLCTNRGITDLSCRRSVGVLYHKPAPRESDKDPSQPLPPAELRMWQTAQHQLERCVINQL